MTSGRGPIRPQRFDQVILITPKWVVSTDHKGANQPHRVHRVAGLFQEVHTLEVRTSIPPAAESRSFPATHPTPSSFGTPGRRHHVQFKVKNSEANDAACIYQDRVKRLRKFPLCQVVCSALGYRKCYGPAAFHFLLTHLKQSAKEPAGWQRFSTTRIYSRLRETDAGRCQGVFSRHGWPTMAFQFGVRKFLSRLQVRSHPAGVHRRRSSARPS